MLEKYCFSGFFMPENRPTDNTFLRAVSAVINQALRGRPELDHILFYASGFRFQPCNHLCAGLIREA
jgi:hypothetical protein